MTHETTAPVQSLVDEILADLDQSTAGHCELNTSNYDHDDVCRLNDWGVDACMALEKAAELIREQQALIAQHAAPVAGQDALRAKAENFVARMRKGAEGDRAAERELEGEDADEAQACAVQAYIQEGAADMVEQLLAAAPTPPAGPWESPCTPPAQQPSVFWVLFDATGPEKFIKKMMPEGFLAFFDNESDAWRAKAQNPGTDFKRVEYYKAPPAQQSQAELVLLNACEDALAWFESRTKGFAIDAKDTLRMAIAEVRSNTAPPAPEQDNPLPLIDRHVIVLNGYQLKEALEFLAPDIDDPEQLECEVGLLKGDESFEGGPGMYAYLAGYPEEGVCKLEGIAPPAPERAEQDAVKVPRELLQEAADELAFQDQQWLNEDAMGLRTTPPRVSRLLGKLRALLGGGA